MDGESFRTCARVMQRQSDTLSEDAMIAATTAVHRLTVVTGNGGDFAHFGVALPIPFAKSRR